MKPITSCVVAIVLSVLPALAVAAQQAEEAPEKSQPPEAASPPSMGEVLAASKPGDWLPLDPEETVYMELPAGRVVISLAPELAPQHVANIRTLVKQRYFDGLAIVRSQENYVVQWGDPAEEATARRPLGEARAELPAEFDRAIDPEQPVTVLPDGDVYASEVGFFAGLPVAVDREKGRMWPAHCYGMVGAGRDVAVDSGSGAELYVVIGHSPRHLDLNVTLVGRVVQGMELLTTLPRGTGPLGFYESPEEYVPIASIRLAAQVPAAERTELEVLRTDTATFEALIESRRSRHEGWFAAPTDRIGLCNVPLPVRPRSGG